MILFHDTSALVALLINETHSDLAIHAWNLSDSAYAWSWGQVETEAALSRRSVPPQTWTQWKNISSQINWLDMAPRMYPQLCLFNRSLKLRSADAGHLFVLDRLLESIPEAMLLSFDNEMLQAAQNIGLPLYPTPDRQD